jgi:uncharacterized RDD family membrane protein YckC
MFCPKCGTANSDQASFCQNCGFDLKSVVVESRVQQAPQAPAITPSIPIQSAMTTTAIQYAGFWIRLVARIIDSLIGFAAGLIIGIVTAGIGYVLAIVIDWLYCALMESSSHQATLGKMALGLKVTDLNGNRISFGRATARDFSKILSGLVFSIGFLMIAVTAKKQGLHDMIAGTLVVKK